MKNIIYILSAFALCFGFKAQAQNYEVALLKDKLKTLQNVEKEQLEYLIFGTPALLILDSEPTYAWNIGKSIETVDISPSKIGEIKKSLYSDDMKSAKLLILRFEEGDEFQLSDSDLNSFQNLQYVVIRYHINISRDEIENKIKNLRSKSSFKNLLFLLEPNNGKDEGI